MTVPAGLPDRVEEALRAPLIDHHCHGVRRDDLQRAEFETLITESRVPAPPGTTQFDTPVGTAVRRWCAPLLDLEPHVAPAVYLSRREELGAEEVNRRMLRGAGALAFLVDTGLHGEQLLNPGEMGLLGEAAADEIVRLERIEHEVAAGGRDTLGYLHALEEEVDRRGGRAAGLKTIIAYRHGLDFDPARPARGEVTAAAGRRLMRPDAPLTDPVLLRHLLWLGVDVARERGVPIQVHTGLGDADLELHRADPARMTGFIRKVQPTGVPLIMLHCYPHHRRAAYLAAVYQNVYVDLGLALTYTAAGAGAVVNETLELAPYHKVLFSSDCYGLAELAHLGAVHFRRGLARALAVRLDEDEWCPADAARIAGMIGSGNARRVYGI